jgi:two-component system, cell cycle response regulator DivK
MENKKKTIMIVDDDQALIDILEISIGVIHNVNVIKVNTGEESLAAAEELQPDLIIMDYKMPGVNGWEATKLIKDNPKTSHIPIIGYTAWAGIDDVKKGISSGLKEIISKPMDFSSWEEKLNYYLL